MYWCDWSDELELIRTSFVCVLRGSVRDPLFEHVCFFQAPLWAYLLCAVGLFVYQSLDAIDGKQARRTNSSSPLGELFDHGCDSLSTGQFLFLFFLFDVVLPCPSESEALNRCSCVCLCSVCGVGNQYSSADGHQSRLDVLLLLRRDVYVLLCPLANLRVRNAALRHVSQQKLLVFLVLLFEGCFVFCFLNKKIIYNNLSINNAQELEFSS